MVGTFSINSTTSSLPKPLGGVRRSGVGGRRLPGLLEYGTKNDNHLPQGAALAQSIRPRGIMYAMGQFEDLKPKKIFLAGGEVSSEMRVYVMDTGININSLKWT